MRAGTTAGAPIGARSPYDSGVSATSRTRHRDIVLANLGLLRTLPALAPHPPASR
jgi:hypothetical protein